jgi:hypothetical protein
VSLMPHPGITHGHELAPAFAFGAGGFVIPHLAFMARVSCGAGSTADLCFLGANIEAWLGNAGWIAAGMGVGYDGPCIGRETTAGLDAHWCDQTAAAIDVRVGLTLDSSAKRERGPSLSVEFIQVGTFSSEGAGDSVSLQLGYQWH